MAAPVVKRARHTEVSVPSLPRRLSASRWMRSLPKAARELAMCSPRGAELPRKPAAVTRLRAVAAPAPRNLIRVSTWAPGLSPMVQKTRDCNRSPWSVLPELRLGQSVRTRARHVMALLAVDRSLASRPASAKPGRRRRHLSAPCRSIKRPFAFLSRSRSRSATCPRPITGGNRQTVLKLPRNGGRPAAWLREGVRPGCRQLAQLRPANAPGRPHQLEDCRNLPDRAAAGQCGPVRA